MISGWAHHPVPARASSHSSHTRSYSTGPRASPIQSSRGVSRTISTSSLRSMSGVLHSPGHQSHSPSRLSSYNDEDENMSTIPDPRSRTMSPSDGSAPPSPMQHPDLNDEVATLSTKLINAINHQTNLDDSLNATRHELDSSQERVRQLEQEALEHTSQINSGALLRFNVVQAERKTLLAKLADERKQREEAEKGKKGMELELENLTQALFEEANKMVITAREAAKKEYDIVLRRNDQLKAQLEDTKSLLKSHQEQLAELKQVMEQMSEVQDDQTNPTAPSTPALARFDEKEESGNTAETLQSASTAEEILPSYPTSFTHLLQPVLRTDLAAYDDFASLLRISKLTGAPGSRVSSGSYVGLGLGLGLGGYTSHMSTNTASQINANSSTVSLGSSSPGPPTTPVSAASNGTATTSSPIAPLKETRFYKRALAEDIEPTLRLDTAPGLSWLARRSVLTAMCDGTLVVEPMPTPSTSVQKSYVFACSLCGETRQDETHARTHRFRTSESDSAQRYPLCKYCLGRVRSSCDFLGFLRVLKDGHWRTDDEESEKLAWEESVRLREQMFWCRMGGGVIPVHSQHTHSHANTQSSNQKSPRVSEEIDTMKDLEGELQRTGEIRPRDITPVTEPIVIVKATPDDAGNAAFLAKRRSEKMGRSSQEDDTAAGLWTAAQDDAADPTKKEDMENQALHRHSTPTPAFGELGKEKEEKRLSITIPGAFE